MRRDDLYLADIVEAADAVSRFVENITEEEFVTNDMRRSAVLQKLAVIGEAAARISSMLKQGAPDVPWSQIVAFRNIAVHAYFNVDWSIVWHAAVYDAPMLRSQIVAIQKNEQPNDDGGNSQ